MNRRDSTGAISVKSLWRGVCLGVVLGAAPEALRERSGSACSPPEPVRGKSDPRSSYPGSGAVAPSNDSLWSSDKGLATLLATASIHQLASAMRGQRPL